MLIRSTPLQSLWSAALFSCALLLSTCALDNNSFAREVVYRLSEDQVKVIKRVAPTYPVIAKQMNVGGKVVVDLTVNEDGSVEKAETVTGSPILAQAALMAGRNWKFEPVKAAADGAKPVVRVNFNFAPR